EQNTVAEPGHDILTSEHFGVVGQREALRYKGKIAAQKGVRPGKRHVQRIKYRYERHKAEDDEKYVQYRKPQPFPRALFHSVSSPASLKRAEKASIKRNMMMDIAEL